MPEETARVPRSVVVAMWAAAVLTVAALVGSALLRELPGGTASAQTGGLATPSAAPSSSNTGVGINCGVGQCREFGATSVGNTKVSLLADTTGANSFIRFTEDNGNNLLETKAGDYGGKVDKDSLSCLPGKYQACLVTFTTTQTTGQARVATLIVKVPGRTWVRAESQIVSEVGVMQLKHIDEDEVPEVLVADSGVCVGASSQSSCKQYTIRGYNHEGVFIGCTPPVKRVEQLDGWRNDLRATKESLRGCKS
ncbi:hypothetical protein JOF53_003529 [Crossiella equi]|uniref:Secreted protein n=1 Tax=Crossiella equi TaxID=130796 RepID=A0ABS5AEC7_9PSEU|nr:hypothetical protein [Crossiella equi]MBP2474657.1 hypothetical protein [Crossiella equi]